MYYGSFIDYYDNITNLLINIFENLIQNNNYKNISEIKKLTYNKDINNYNILSGYYINEDYSNYDLDLLMDCL